MNKIYIKLLTICSLLFNAAIALSAPTNIPIHSQENEHEKYVFEYNFSKGTDLNQPTISSHEVSLVNGVYGVKLGSDYQMIIDKFGNPSAEFIISGNYLIIGYGRRHWFHFQDNSLVKVQNKSPILSQELVNKIPLRELFDDFSWKINGISHYNSKLEDVQKSLKIDDVLIKNNQVVLNQNGSVLTLDFIHSKKHDTGEISDWLAGFSLQAKDYRPIEIFFVDNNIEQFTLINQLYSDLEKEQEINWQVISEKLGDPIGRIRLNEKSQLLIFNSHLLVRQRYSDLAEILFVEQALIHNGNQMKSTEPWRFGPFVQGLSIKQHSNVIPENAFESENEVEFSSSFFELLLSFDETEGRSSLYEAKMKLY